MGGRREAADSRPPMDRHGRSFEQLAADQGGVVVAQSSAGTSEQPSELAMSPMQTASSAEGRSVSSRLPTDDLPQHPGWLVPGACAWRHALVVPPAAERAVDEHEYPERRRHSQAGARGRSGASTARRRARWKRRWSINSGCSWPPGGWASCTPPGIPSARCGNRSRRVAGVGQRSIIVLRRHLLAGPTEESERFSVTLR